MGRAPAIALVSLIGSAAAGLCGCGEASSSASAPAGNDAATSVEAAAHSDQDAATAPEQPTQDGAPSCEGFGGGNCPSDRCEVQCCPGGPECASCCVPKPCQGFDAQHCPIERCQLLPACNGGHVCFQPFSAPAPACGGVGYYGAAVPCCAGLVARCGVELPNGQCNPMAGGYSGVAWCVACGNGTCDTTFENRCSCPEDCH